MVKVPEYEQSVALRPNLRQDVDVRATPEAFGADIGRGMQDLAHGMGQAAEAMVQVQAMEDAVRAKDADNAYSDWMRERMYGEGGYMTLEGRSAVDTRAAFEREAEEKRKEFGKDLTGGAARSYQDASQARLRSSFQQSIIHSANERKRWFTASSDARVDTFKNDAVVNAGKTDQFNKNLAAGILEIREQGKMHSWDADTLRLKEQAFVSDAHKQVVMSIGQTDPLKAAEYIKANGDRLTAADRLEVDRALRGPMLKAKDEADADRILSGAPSAADPIQAPTGEPGSLQSTEPQKQGAVSDPAKPEAAAVAGLPGVKADARGNHNFMDVARSLVGKHEVANNAAIASFIRRYAGIEIDPAKTPWCAGFVNGVLGANGVRGTGKLTARSFLAFGTVTDSPREGDIVVLSLGDDPSKGHVGFFAGFDALGNVRVLGGNQGNKVSTETFSRDRVLPGGFRRASSMGSDMPQPNATVPGLEHIENELANVDPTRRDAVRKEIASRIQFRESYLRQQREEVQRSAEQWIIANPGQSPNELPLEVRTTLGVAGMNTLYAWRDKVVASGQPETDQNLLYDLRTLYADDPEAFGQLDLFKVRDRLNNEDWKQVNGWRQAARTDQRKAREDGLNLNSAFAQAKEQLEAVGIAKNGGRGHETHDANVAKQVAQFQNALAEEMEAFKRNNNNKAPTQAEVQSMINKMLLPIVVRTPGIFWDSHTPMHLFEAGGRPDNSTMDVTVEYKDIPIDLRRSIALDLERELGRKPSQDEVTQRYEDVALGR